MPQNVNRVVLTGNLTRDPELKSASGGLQICNMRVACNGRVKRDDRWEDKANYFDVVCFGAQAENAHRFLAKGRAVAIDGRLDWREWEAEGGGKRQAVQIIAENVQFLSDGNRDSDGGGGGGGGESHSSPAAASSVSTPPLADDDIPF